MLRIFLFLQVIVLTGCEDWRVDSCLDNGGRWNEEIQECECTYKERGNKNLNPSKEEIEQCSKKKKVK